MNTVVETLKYNMLNYGGYIITDRVLPSIEDGLKPSYRRILWTMEKQKAVKFVKSGNVAGNVFKFHPHGNVYPTMVNMTQMDRQNVPYLTGKGNFGQYTSKNLQAGAERYTECKLSDMSLDMLDGIKRNMVEMIDNYDGTEKMPKYLPVKYPSVLCYASQGIGLGMSSNIPSYNIVEVCNATINYLQSEKKEILYPDFATGGYIIKDEKAFENIIMNGKGPVKLRGKYIIEGDNIKITEIPYGTFREDIIDKIIENIKNGKLKEISNVRDLTGLKGLCIEICCKKNVDMELLMEKLYKLTPLESTFSANINVLVDGSPMVLGFYEIIDEWYKFRVECIKRALSNDANKIKKELHLSYGLKKVLLDIDKAIKLIRNSENPEGEIEKNFLVDNVQAKFICNIPLRNINNDYIVKQINEIADKEKEYKNLINIINTPEALMKLVINNLNGVIKKFGVERKTKLIEINKDINIKEIVNDGGGYNVKVQLTKDGYFKKVKANAYKGENKLKDGDYIISELDATNSDEIVFFGDDLNAYKFKLYELEDNKLNSLGTYIPNLINAQTLGMTALTEENKFIIICYKDRISKIDIKSFTTLTNRRKLTKSLFNDEVTNILTFSSEKTLVIKSKKGKIKEFKTEEIITKSSRNSQGIKILGKDEIEESYCLGDAINDIQTS